MTDILEEIKVLQYADEMDKEAQDGVFVYGDLYEDRRI